MLSSAEKMDVIQLNWRHIYYIIHNLVSTGILKLKEHIRVTVPICFLISIYSIVFGGQKNKILVRLACRHIDTEFYPVSLEIREFPKLLNILSINLTHISGFQQFKGFKPTSLLNKGKFLCQVLVNVFFFTKEQSQDQKASWLKTSQMGLFNSYCMCWPGSTRFDPTQQPST